eukprot:TRINITY_DN1555_c0_g1_i13.p1 TRINITY_DN1555_c0_g1~~TRINITY_DN1555_c0_g1_i13.p1  ORF type:complete len:334 (-),score=32.79 TRINITY_DN1555_c0_g1_i13:792-1793(-)
MDFNPMNRYRSVLQILQILYSETNTLDQQYYKITQLPGSAEYLSYLFHFGSCLCGPFFNYRDFSDFVEEKGHYAIIPDSSKAGFISLSQAAFFLSMIVFFLPKFSLSFILGEDWQKSSILYQFLYIQAFATLLRMRYYAGWKLAQTSIDFQGLSYNGYEDFEEKQSQVKWDRVETSVIRCEYFGDWHYYAECWNRSIHLWLKHNVYERLIKNAKVKGSMASNATFIISAFWHGFYPAYYLVFLYFALSNQLSKHFFKLGKNVSYFRENVVFNVFVSIFFRIIINYIIPAFFCLDVASVFEYFNRTNYTGVVVLFGSFLFFEITKIGQNKPKKE